MSCVIVNFEIVTNIDYDFHNFVTYEVMYCAVNFFYRIQVRDSDHLKPLTFCQFAVCVI